MSSSKTGEVAKNYKMLANPVFITPGRIILQVITDIFLTIKVVFFVNFENNVKGQSIVCDLFTI